MCVCVQELASPMLSATNPYHPDQTEVFFFFSLLRAHTTSSPLRSLHNDPFINTSTCVWYGVVVEKLVQAARVGRDGRVDVQALKRVFGRRDPGPKKMTSAEVSPAIHAKPALIQREKRRRCRDGRIAKHGGSSCLVSGRQRPQPFSNLVRGEPAHMHQKCNPNHVANLVVDKTLPTHPYATPHLSISPRLWQLRTRHTHYVAVLRCVVLGDSTPVGKIGKVVPPAITTQQRVETGQRPVVCVWRVWFTHELPAAAKAVLVFRHATGEVGAAAPTFTPHHPSIDDGTWDHVLIRASVALVARREAACHRHRTMYNNSGSSQAVVELVHHLSKSCVRPQCL
eukprot:m.226739 g.226739  ORF g.226739 m.226739 type:complete len:340 (-) comp18804_c0_seq2:550-1569(-)